MGTDGKTHYPFPLPYFFTGNGSGTGIAGNGMGTGIDGYTEANIYWREYNENGREPKTYTRMTCYNLQDMDLYHYTLNIESTHQQTFCTAAA